MVRKVLLACGVLSSLLYVAMNVVAAMLYEGYSAASQTVSELSAIGAPTRPMWVLLGAVYTLLLSAFGAGVRLSAGRDRPLRVVGGLMIVQGVVGLFWPPMHQRGAEQTLTDALHIVFTAVTVLLITLEIGYGAAAHAHFNRKLRAMESASGVVPASTRLLRTRMCPPALSSPLTKS